MLGCSEVGYSKLYCNTRFIFNLEHLKLTETYDAIQLINKDRSHIYLSQQAMHSFLLERHKIPSRRTNIRNQFKSHWK